MNRKRFYCASCKKETYHTVMSVQIPRGRSHIWYQAFYMCDECGLLTRIPIVKYVLNREPEGELEKRISVLSGLTAREAYAPASLQFGKLTYTDVQNMLERGVKLGLLKKIITYAPLEKVKPAGKCSRCGSPVISLYSAKNGSKKRTGWYCPKCGSYGYERA